MTQIKIEAKTRLCASFEKDLLDNLGSMSAAQLRSLHVALVSVSNWFYGRAMQTNSDEDINLVVSSVPPTGAVDLNLAANGMAWLTKVFGIKVPQGPYYRIHDLDFVAQKDRDLNLYRNDRESYARKLREKFPVGTSMTVENSKPLVSFTSDLSAVKKFSKTNGGKKKDTDVYLKVEQNNRVTPVFFNGAIPSTAIAAAKSVDKKAAYAKTKDKVLLKNVTSSLVYALMIANEFKHQKEVVCVLKGKKFDATLLEYAKR